MKGFTLIEILAAAGMLAILAILVHGSFNISASIWKERQQDIEQEQDARIAMDILRQKISCAYCSPWHKEGDPSAFSLQPSPLPPEFDGRQDEISLRAANSRGISTVRFYLEGDGEVSCLWMEETVDADYSIDRGAASARKVSSGKHKLCDGVTRFEAGYYDGRSWTSDWSQDTPPQLVRVCLTLTQIKDAPLTMVIPVRVGEGI